MVFPGKYHCHITAREIPVFRTEYMCPKTSSQKQDKHKKPRDQNHQNPLSKERKPLQNNNPTPKTRNRR